MKTSAFVTILMSLALVCPLALAAKPKPKPQPTPPPSSNSGTAAPSFSITLPTPYTFVKAVDTTVFERPQLLVTVVSVLNGAQEILLYPGRDANTDPNVVNLFKDLKPGNLVNITGAEVANRATLLSITPYKPVDGEDEPGVFLFRRTVDTVEGIKGKDSIEVCKMGKLATLTMQTVKDPLNGVVPDPAITKVIDKAKFGALLILDIRMAGQIPVVQGAMPYTPPLRAQYMSVAFKGDNGKELEFAVVELKTETGIENIKIPNTTINGVKGPDQALVATLTTFKMGQIVNYRLKPDDANVPWLYQIQVPPPEKIAEKTPASVPAVTKAEK